MAQLSIMLKPASSRCNFNCEYCFYRDEALSRAVADYGSMNTVHFDILLSKAISYARGGHISLTFQGGEPLLAGKGFFYHVFDKIREADYVDISVSVQTNGSLIDEEWATMFADNKVLVGVSIDGNKSCNRHRITARGDNSFNDIVRGINYLKAFNVDFNAVIVATPITAAKIKDIYAFFKRNNIKYLQFIPCLATLDGKADYAMTAAEYGNMLCELFELYHTDYVSGDYVSIRYFDNLINLARLGRCEQCGVGGVCSRQYVVEARGNVYPCDFYCLDEYLLGNIMTDDFAFFERSGAEFIRETAMKKIECNKCSFYRLCLGGGCKRERASIDYCLAYRMFFSKNYHRIVNMK